MDGFSQLQQQLAQLQQENAQLRSGRNQALSQADFLRNQQALQGYGVQQDRGQTPAGSSWYEQLGIAPSETTGQPAQAPAQPQTISLTPQEFQQAVRAAAQQEFQAQYAQQGQARNTQLALQNRLVQEYPDLARDHAPVIDQVWRAKQTEMAGRPAEDIYKATMETTAQLVNHVQSKVAQPATNPYGIQVYGTETPPWMRPQEKQDPNDIFQAMPGNERQEWHDSFRGINRMRRAKAMNVYVSPAANPQGQ